MLLSNCFEELCQALRVLLEADARANRGNLLQVDRAEAVGNIETALSTVLNSFHSLYDAMGKSSEFKSFNWFEYGELAAVLSIRNARHHNHANRIRTLYTYHVQEAPKPTKMVSYVYVDFPSPDPTADTFDVFLSWSDMLNLFSLPQSTTRLHDKTKQKIIEYLQSDRFSSYAQHYQRSEQHIFFNCVPLFVNASARTVPFIAPHVKPNSTEAEFFLDHFSSVEPADFANPTVDCGPFVLFE